MLGFYICNTFYAYLTTSTRMKQLVEEKTTPKNRNEQEIAAYRDFEDRFAIVEEKLPAIDMVRKASLNKIGKFTKQDIRELCPSLSISSIEGSLRKMVADGELRRKGTGKSTYYVRLK